ncbi:hypothetical protein ACT453_59185, partial [Bacillus sp. D-CC]
MEKSRESVSFITHRTVGPKNNFQESFLNNSNLSDTYGIQEEFKLLFDGFLKVIFRPDSPMRDERDT